MSRLPSKAEAEAEAAQHDVTRQRGVRLLHISLGCSIFGELKREFFTLVSILNLAFNESCSSFDLVFKMDGNLDLSNGTSHKCNITRPGRHFLRTGQLSIVLLCFVVY
uniref:Uncharacterized protein n=1 Tax=Strigamia maritima TaxID=126957 RepID=T1JBB5_STRMM